MRSAYKIVVYDNFAHIFAREQIDRVRANHTAAAEHHAFLAANIHLVA
jgi:hypothetical protein